MCGLVAFISKKNNGFSKEQVDAFDNLLYIDALRGMDSTGVFMVDRAGNMDLCKEATPSFYFRQDDEYKNLLATAFQRGRALVGHNRAATKGQVTDENAHPFVVDDRITLCHNGTLWGDFTKLTKEKVEVDSHAIAHKIHEKGDDVEAALQDLSGAYALIWHDFKNNTLNFVRNAQRPLHWVEVADGYIWASEANMIEWILARYDFKPKGKVSPLDAGILVTYDFSNDSWKVDTKEITLEAPKPVYTPPDILPHNIGRRHYNYYDEDGYSDDDLYYPAAAPTCGLPETPHRVQQQNSSIVRQISNNGQIQRLPTPNQASTMNRIINYEQRMMQHEGIDQKATVFMDETANSIPSGSNQVGVCFDFIQIMEGNPMGGWFLYARLEANPDYVVKCHVPSKMTENYLLDLTINQRQAVFVMDNRSWRSYNDAAAGIGYGMFTAKSFTEVVEVDMEKSE